MSSLSSDSDFVLPWKPFGRFGRSLPIPWAAALLVSLLTFGLYVYTLAPNVTLEDSGEYITAAATLGVTHPPGYPTWTTISHLFVTLLPIGNVAWRVNLVSAVFGAIANGLAAWLVAHSTRWLLDERDHEHERETGFPRWFLPFLGAVTAGLCLGCSEVMWSQSVIVEVYTLNATLLLATLSLFYWWVRDPQRTGRLLAATVCFAFGLTNHHTLMFLLPVLLLGVWMVRRDFFPTFCIGVFLFSLSAMAVLVWFADDARIILVTQRLSFFILALVLGIALSQVQLGEGWTGQWRRFLAWGLVGLVLDHIANHVIGGWFHVETVNGVLLAVLVVVVFGVIGVAAIDRRFLCRVLVLCALCISIYGMERVYSATNPPMNWSYARLKGGFFQSVSRGQYTNSLSNLIVSHFGPWLGVPAATPPAGAAAAPSALPNLVRSAASYFNGLEDNFSLPLCLIAFLSLFLFGNLSRERRRWLYFLLAAFLMLSFFMAVIDPAAAWDRQTWAIRRRFFLPAHCIFALCLGYGVAGGLLALRRYERKTPLWAFALAPLLAAIPLVLNYPTSTQRGHWFGWQYGTDMLRPLEKGAVVFGGTDPGRFVPTYMIFCESPQPARWKHDPAFDRSDLYLITQNALGDYFYLRYLTDQYDADRRQKTFNGFERWLGRDRAYPEGGIHMPTEQEFADVFTEFDQKHQARSAANPDGSVAAMGTQEVFELNGMLAKVIFDKNKAHHSFYIEESLPIPWMYPYLTPAGLIMKINPEPLPTLPPEVIAQDRAFWDRYAQNLLDTPGFTDDVDAQNSFAKLRLSIGNLYAFRHLDDEAIYAYEQALRLSPSMPEAVGRLVPLYIQHGRKEEAEKLIATALEHDPEDQSFQQLSAMVRLGKEFDAREQELRAAIATNGDNLELQRKLAALLLTKRDSAAAAPVIAAMGAKFALPPQEMADYVRATLEGAGPEAALALLQDQLRFTPGDPILTYQQAAISAVAKRPDDAFRFLGQAIERGRSRNIDFTGATSQDASWNDYRNDPRFLKLVGPASSTPPPPTAPAKK